ncbi:hypothetical protein H6G36_25660 [Anabaena minutissima FACHB-250]|nr:hypothetical protein [Anabaena minutissima FACHB-250]
MDKQLKDTWQQFLKKRFAAVTTSGGRNNQMLWVAIEGRRLQARCFGNVPRGECMAAQLDTGEWLLVDTQIATIPQESTRNIELRRTKNKGKKRGSLQVLFYEIVQTSTEQRLNWYIGGDRPTPLLIHSEVYAGVSANQIEDGVFFPEFELSDLVNLGKRKFIACIGNQYKTPAINRFPVDPLLPINPEANFFKIIYINNQQATEYNLNYLPGYDHTKAYRYLGEGILAGTPRMVQRTKLTRILDNYYQDLPAEYFGTTYCITPNNGETIINAETSEHSYSTPVPLLGGVASFDSTYSGTNQLSRTFTGENIIQVGRDNTKITEYLAFDQQGETVTQSREIRFYRGDNYTLLNTLDGVRVNHNFSGGGNKSVHNLNIGDTFTVLPDPESNYFYEETAVGSLSEYFPTLVGQEILFSNIFNNQYWLARCEIISYDSQFTLQILDTPATTPYCSFASTSGSFILNNGSYYNLVIVNDPEFIYNAIVANNYLSPVSNLNNTTDFKKSDPDFIFNDAVNFLDPRYRQVDLYGATSPGLDTTAYLRYTDNRYCRLVKNVFYKVKPVSIEELEEKIINYVEVWKIINGSVFRTGVEKVKVEAIATDTLPEDLFFRDFLDVDYSPD